MRERKKKTLRNESKSFFCVVQVYFATQPMASLGGFSVSIQMNSMRLYMKTKLQCRTSQVGSNLQNLSCSNLLSKN